MKTLLAILLPLSVPIVLLNVFGGIVSGVWLAILGHWGSIGLGLCLIVGSAMFLAFAMMPGFLLMMPAVRFAERENYVAMYLVAFVGSAYTFTIITLWCATIMWFFVNRATEGSLVPLLLWSYGVAIAPLSFMASKDTEREGAIFSVFFPALAYVAGGIWLVFGSPRMLSVTVLMACIIGLGVLAMYAISIETMTRKKA